MADKLRRIVAHGKGNFGGPCVATAGPPQKEHPYSAQKELSNSTPKGSNPSSLVVSFTNKTIKPACKKKNDRMSRAWFSIPPQKKTHIHKANGTRHHK
jgi:hypothetical protein